MRHALLGLLPACWSSGEPVKVAAPAPTVVRSCAIDPPRRERSAVRVVEWLGQIGERTWLLGATGDKLQLISYAGGQLDVRDAGRAASFRASAVEGRHVYVAGETGLDLDLDRGTSSPFVLEPGADSIAVGRTRMLVARDHALALHDRAGATIGDPISITTMDLRAPTLRCVGDHCFAIGIEGDGPSRRIYAAQFDPAGTVHRGHLGPEHAAGYLTHSLGTRTLVVWRAFDDRGPRAQLLDASGMPIGRRAELGLPTADDVEIAAGPQLLWRGRDARQWAIQSLDTRDMHLGLPRGLAFNLPARQVEIGALPDGHVVTGASSNVDYEAGYHTWHAHAETIFVPTDGEPSMPRELIPPATGDGRSGLAAFPLVSPGHAAVLVVPFGPEANDQGQLVVVREPCR